MEVLQIIRVEEEVSAAFSGDNIKLRLKGIEEEVSCALRAYHLGCSASSAIFTDPFLSGYGSSLYLC